MENERMTPRSEAQDELKELRSDIQYRGRSRLARVLTAAHDGLRGYVCQVEVCLMQGLPYFDLVGSSDKTLREAPDRIKAALRMSGYKFPDTRIVVNLSPAWLAKRGSSFDLPIALGILLASGQLVTKREIRAFGELALDGSVKPVPGAYILAQSLTEAPGVHCLVPFENYKETNYFGENRMLPAASLRDACRRLAGSDDVFTEGVPALSLLPAESEDTPDLSILKGQGLAVEALQVCAAGGHHMMVYGSAGCGKTTLASCLAGILPDLDPVSQREIAAIYSVAGRLVDSEMNFAKAPFRSPHFSTTQQALFGGGPFPRPGEVSLAHRGVLFLDELTAFPSQTLTRLLVPLEHGHVEIARLRQTVTFPAEFQLLAAANPCPCGKLLDGGCRCPQGDIERYRRKIIGPFRDRIDLQISMLRVPQSLLSRTVQTDDTLMSPSAKVRIIEARNHQRARHQEAGLGAILNSHVPGERLADIWEISPQVLRYSEAIAARLDLSVRGFQKVLRVARTIADLEQRRYIRREDLDLSVHFRSQQEDK